MSDDPFEEISNLNSKAYSDGHAEGTVHGRRAAILEGMRIGKLTAFNIGSEIGQYLAVCETYAQENDSHIDNEKSKHVKLASQIVELIHKFDLIDCHSDKFASDLNQIRDKFKQFCSVTNLKNYVKEEDLSMKNKLNF